MTCVIVGESEVYLCDMSFLGVWISAGYRLFGAADSLHDVLSLYRMAKAETGVR